MMRATTAIVLAAGLSTRMRAQKLLLSVDGKPMLQHGLDLVRGLPFSRRVLVTTPEVAEQVEMAGIELVINPVPEAGQSGSVQLGVLAAPPDDSLLFLMGDQPFLDAVTLEALLAADDGQRIVYPVGPGNTPRSPVLFGPRFREALLALRGDEGGRQLRRQYPGACLPVRIQSEWVLLDIDTPADYREAAKRCL